jgi:hypothetical protein
VCTVVANDEQYPSSMAVFRVFIKREVHSGHGQVIINAEGIVSKGCYELWVSSRKQTHSKPGRAFQRALSAHVTATDGRTCFSKEEEEAILIVLRRKERWPCFEGSDHKMGAMGFREFHQQAAHFVLTQTISTQEPRGTTRLKQIPRGQATQFCQPLRSPSLWTFSSFTRLPRPSCPTSTREKKKQLRTRHGRPSCASYA